MRRAAYPFQKWVKLGLALSAGHLGSPGGHAARVPRPLRRLPAKHAGPVDDSTQQDQHQGDGEPDTCFGGDDVIQENGPTPFDSSHATSPESHDQPDYVHGDLVLVDDTQISGDEPC